MYWTIGSEEGAKGTMEWTKFTNLPFFIRLRPNKLSKVGSSVSSMFSINTVLPAQEHNKIDWHIRKLIKKNWLDLNKQTLY